MLFRSYMEGWLRGVGCVPINYLMEDAATAEVSRSQLWQWVRHGVTTAEGKKVDKAYALRLLKEQADSLASKAQKGNKYHLAAQYFAGQVTGEDYADFLTSYVPLTLLQYHGSLANITPASCTTRSPPSALEPPPPSCKALDRLVTIDGWDRLTSLIF